jgi:uncharacterized protein (UPF0261 family)
MRTTPDENAQLGALIARKVNQAEGPVSVFIPTGGVSMIDAPDQPFHDPVADRALFDALRGGLRPGIECIEMSVNINEPSFGVAMANRLHDLVTQPRAATAAAAQRRVITASR